MTSDDIIIKYYLKKVFFMLSIYFVMKPIQLAKEVLHSNIAHKETLKVIFLDNGR